MKNFLKLIRKTPFRSLALTLLLCLGCCVAIIGISAWYSAMEQGETVISGYVTIAVAREQEMDKWELSGTTYEDGSIQWGDGTWYYSPQVLDQTASAAPQVEKIDRRCLLSAHVEGVPALSSGTNDVLQYNEAMDRYCYNLCVLAARCTSVEDVSSPGYEGENSSTWGHKTYLAEFELLDGVSWVPAYELEPAQSPLGLYTTLYNADGSIPFEAGKTYLLRGFYQDFPIVEDRKKDDQGSLVAYYRRPDPEAEPHHCTRVIRFTTDALTQYTTETYESSGTDEGLGHANFTINRGLAPDVEMAKYEYAPEDGLPYFVEYTGNWEDFLNTPEGQVWRDEIIPLCELNHHSASLILTDDLESMYAFHSGSASILEGSAFSEEMYAQGQPVCLISANYAQANGLEVGSVLDLDFYDTGCGMETGFTRGLLGDVVGNTIVRYPLQEENRIGFRQEYTVIGIYTAPAFSFGLHSFHADTIFIPKASLPNAQSYEDTSVPLLNSLVLKNGTEQEFEAYMEKAGYGGQYLYFDQEFQKVGGTLEALRANAARLLWISLGIFVLTLLLFLFLLLRRMAPVSRGMRLLGLRKGQVWLELMETMGILSAVSVAAGIFLGASLFNTVTRRLLSDTITLHATPAALCAGGQLFLLLACSMVLTKRMAGQNMMQKKR